MPAWVFDASPIDDQAGRAARVLRFADILKHPLSTAPGNALQLKPWQRRIIQRIYGPSNPDGTRAVRTVFLLLPRGGRKTTLGAVLALAHAIGPEQRPSGQIILAAGDRGQARIAFDESREIIKSDPRLLHAVKIQDTKSRVTHGKSRSIIEAVSADGDRQHGRTPAFLLADEVHIWPGFSLWSALKTGLSKVPGSLNVIITTMGAEEGASPVFDELLSYAEKVESGEVIDPSFLPVLFRAPDDLPWDSEEAWHIANPGLEDGFPDLASLRDEARQAAQIPRMRIEFERLHLNRRPSSHITGGLFDMSAWDARAATISASALEGARAWGGLDMSRSYDLTALSWLVETDGGHVLHAHGFIPESALKKRAVETDLPWREWADKGWLTVIPGDVIDDDVIAAAVREGCAKYDAQAVGFDPKFAGKLAASLLADSVPMVEFSQRIVMMAPGYLAFQKAVIGGTMQHDDSPLLRWNLTCAHVMLTENSLPVVSKKRSRGAVDLLVSSAIAFGLAETATGSIYDTPQRPDGLLFLS